jgi:SAM-dependent methyltransferase
MNMKTYNPQWVKQFYDDYGEREWNRHELTPTGEVSFHIHRHYLKQTIKPGDRVLEIGPGPGRFTQVLAEIGARVVIVDISSVQLELNRQYARKFSFEHSVIDWLEHDMCDMRTFVDGTFDAVVCYGGPLSYVLDNRQSAMKELLRVLKPGGIALVSVMSLWGSIHNRLDGVLRVSPEENAAIIRTGDLCPQNYRNCVHHCHMFRSQELRELLVRSGTEILAMSASSSLSTTWDNDLDKIRKDPAKWQEILDLELEAGRQPGCLDMGANLIAAVRKKFGDLRP